MSNWSLETRVGGSWVVGTPIQRPNAEFPERKSSTQVVKKLVDGSLSVIIPPTKSIDGEISWTFLNVLLSTKETIESYIDNHTGIRITTHEDSGSKVFIGYFTAISPTWLFDPNENGEQLYNLSTVFFPFDVP